MTLPNFQADSKSDRLLAVIDETEDTLTILNNYVEGLEIKSSKPELQNLLRSLPDEALSVI